MKYKMIFMCLLLFSLNNFNMQSDSYPKYGDKKPDNIEKFLDAIVEGEEQSASALLDVIDNVNFWAYVRLTSYGWKTPLMFAAEFQMPMIIAKLLAKGADPNVATESGQTAIDYAKGNETIINLLKQKTTIPIQTPKSTIQKEPVQTQTPTISTTKPSTEKLIPSAYQSYAINNAPINVKQFVEAINRQNYKNANNILDTIDDVNFFVELQNRFIAGPVTPLMLAIAAETPDVIKKLLLKGANVDAQSYSRTAFTIASDKRNPEIINLLNQSKKNITINMLQKQLQELKNLLIMLDNAIGIKT